jgi:hypothetical protein
MITSARSGRHIPIVITCFCAAVVLAAVSWLIHPGQAAQASAGGTAGTTAHVLAGPPWTGPPPGTSAASSSTGSPSSTPPDGGPPWT